MDTEQNLEKEKLVLLIKKAIELLCEKNISDVVILSSYKINSVLKEQYGVDIKVDRIGRVLSTIAKRNQLKRLNTNIPKYKLHISRISSLKFL
jgi:CTP:phosphocholine cytidylyltransferase-like protein